MFESLSYPQIKRLHFCEGDPQVGEYAENVNAIFVSHESREAEALLSSKKD